MNSSGDAAEQVVRLSLEGTEVALKLTGAAAKNIAAALYTIFKNKDKTKTAGHQVHKGSQTLWRGLLRPARKECAPGRAYRHHGTRRGCS